MGELTTYTVEASSAIPDKWVLQSDHPRHGRIIVGYFDTIAEAIDQSTNAYACMVPLLRAVVDSPLGVVDDLIAHLREAAELERQWPEPVMAYDCVAAGTMVATRLKRPGIAARAYAAIHGQAGRTVGTFAWRAIVRHQLRHALDDPTRQQLTELGKHDAPQTALDDLLTALSA